jgi:uncharacterized delta-60 repeat protein
VRTGFAITDLGTNDVGQSISVDSNKNIIMGGFTGPSSDKVAMIKYDSDGVLDLSFGTNGDGIVITPMTTFSSAFVGECVKVDSLDRILIIGRLGGANFTIMRYDNNGILDLSFGTAGTTTTTGLGVTAFPQAVTIDSANNILVSGIGTVNTSRDFILVRYTDSGVLDLTFNVTGIVATDFGNTASWNNSLTIDSQDRIIVNGYNQSGPALIIALARYTDSGVLDGTFGIGGKVTTDIIGGNADYGLSVTVDANDNVLVCGATDAGADFDFALVRYLENNGALDPAFGLGTGIVQTDFGSTEFGYSVAVDNNNKIIVGGFSDASGQNEFALARYNSDGSLDPTFGTGGLVTTTVGGTDDFGYSVSICANNDILIGGTTNNKLNPYNFTLLKYSSNGVLDNSFGDLITPNDPSLSCSPGGLNTINLLWQTQAEYTYCLYKVGLNPDPDTLLNTVLGDGLPASYPNTGLSPDQTCSYYIIIKSNQNDLNQFATIQCTTVCILPGAIIKTINGSKLIENITKCDIVVDEFGNQIEVINNIKFGFDKKMVITFEQGCFGNNLPDDKLSITYGHPIKIPTNDDKFSEKEYLVQDLVNMKSISIKSQHVDNTYTLITKNREFVMINGIPVCTWTQEDFDKCCADYRKRNMVMLHQLI